MNNKIQVWMRIVLAIGCLMLFAVLYVPIWRIDLDAPQYPEGLEMFISADGLSGGVDIINGLNHYIGMKTLHNEDFMEFKILPYLIPAFALFFLAASIFGIDESAGNFYFGYDNSANPTLNFEATDGDAGEFGFNTNALFPISDMRVKSR